MFLVFCSLSTIFDNSRSLRQKPAISQASPLKSQHSSTFFKQRSFSLLINCLIVSSAHVWLLLFFISQLANIKSTSVSITEELQGSVSGTKVSLAKAQEVIDSQRARLQKLEETHKGREEAQKELFESLESSHQVSERLRTEIEK